MKDILLVLSMTIEMLLFVIFISTGVSKLTNPRKYSAYIYRDFLFLKNVKSKTFMPLIVCLGVLELTLGIVIIFSELSAYPLMFVLCLYILYLFQKTPDSACNCGGILDNFLSNRYQSVVRNFFLLGGCLFIIIFNRPHEFVYDLLILCLSISTLFFVLAYFNIMNLKEKGDTNDA